MKELNTPSGLPEIRGAKPPATAIERVRRAIYAVQVRSHLAISAHNFSTKCHWLGFAFVYCVDLKLLRLVLISAVFL
jgi:hypothetical protein